MLRCRVLFLDLERPFPRVIGNKVTVLQADLEQRTWRQDDVA